MDLATVVSMLSMLIAALMFFLTAFTNYKASKRAQKQATLDAYNMLQEQALDQLNMLSPEDISRICSDPANEKYENVVKILARIEHFSVGVNEKIYDYKTLRSLAHGYFDGTVYDKLSPIIKEKSEYANHYKNYRKLAEKMH